MTIEEKARAYDDALEKAKAHINSKGISDTVDLCKHLFSELRESEDERIRKNTIGYIQERIDEFPGDVRLVKRWKKEIAWLESLPERFTLSIKQEWDGFDEACLKRAIWYVENPASSVIKDFRLALWLNTLRSRFSLKPQPKAEWSEEDERMLKSTIWNISNSVTNGKNTDCKCDLTEWLKEKLKSLRPQKLDASKLENFDPVDVLNRIKTEWPMAWEKVVGKQEWSEEDEKMRDRLIDRLQIITLNTRTDTTSPNITFFDEISWLKSLHPQPKQKRQIKEGDKVSIHCRKDRKEGIIAIYDGKVGEVIHVWDAKRNPWGHIGVRLDNDCNHGFYEDELEVFDELS